MAKTTLFVKLPLADGKFDEFAKAFGEIMIPQVNTEDGTEVYLLSQDSKDANVAWIYEQYTTEDALGAHGGSDAMTAFFGAIGDLLSGAPEMNTATLVSGKGA